MNQFIIDENDQFEIASIQFVDDIENCFDEIDEANQAVENLTRQQNEGLGYFHCIPVFPSLNLI